MPNRLSRAPLALVLGGAPRDASDADLVLGLIARQDWALGETWRRFAPMALRTAETVIGTRTEAEDVAQEVFYQVVRCIRTLRDPDSLRSFVHSFVIRVVKSELRRRKRRRPLFLGSSSVAEDAAVKPHSPAELQRGLATLRSRIAGARGDRAPFDRGVRPAVIRGALFGAALLAVVLGTVRLVAHFRAAPPADRPSVAIPRIRHGAGQ